MTTALRALVTGDAMTAWSANPLLFVLIAGSVTVVFARPRLAVQKNGWAASVFVIGIVGFSILRNVT